MWSEAGSEIGSPKGQRETLKLFTGDEDEAIAPIKRSLTDFPGGTSTLIFTVLIAITLK